MTRAVLFDMDGTLVDTEVETDAAIEDVMAEHGFAGVRLAPELTRGRSWRDVVASLCTAYPIATPPGELERRLLGRWSERTADPRPLPGVVEALREASLHLRLAVVSSSPRGVVERIVERLGVTSCVGALVGADDVARHKPDPEGWLRAASLLGVEPRDCLVVEDASAGLRAARAAGMASLAVLHVSAERALCRELAGACFEHYSALPAGFWAGLARDGVALLESLRGA